MQAPGLVTSREHVRAGQTVQEFLESHQFVDWAATEARWSYHLYVHLSGLLPVREPEAERDTREPESKRGRDLLPQK